MKGSPAILAPLFLASLVSAAPPDSRTDRVNALFKDFDRADVPGCGLGIIQDGHFIYQRGYGMANLDYGIPNLPETVFRIGSVSKQFTAIAIALAAAEGKLSLDDDVRKHLPELRNLPAQVTIRQMLYHSSGIRDYLELMDIAGNPSENDYFTVEDALAIIARQKHLNFPPGDEYLYSNSGYFLISQIIPRATEKSLREWADERIFQPLGMTNTFFLDDLRMIVPNRATGYRRTKGGGFEVDVSKIDLVGDGGVFTKVEDLLIWDQNFYDNKLGGDAVMKEMLTPGVLNDGVSQDYALGLGVSSYRGLDTVGHGGSWVGYRAGILQFPKQKFSVICLCNRRDAQPTALARKIADIYLGEHMTPEPSSVGVAVEEAFLEGRVGEYWGERTGEFVELAVEEGVHVLKIDGYPYRLLGQDENRFRAVRGMDEVDVVFDGNNRLKLQSRGQRPFQFESLRDLPPPETDLGVYRGSYYCEDVDATYQIQLSGDGELTVVGLDLDDPALEPMFRDGFRWEWGSIVFDRDAQGNVSGFRPSMGRARNFRFVRTSQAAPTEPPR